MTFRSSVLRLETGMAVALLLVSAFGLPSCARGDTPEGSPPPRLTGLRPLTLLPGTRVEIRGHGFVPGLHVVELVGTDLRLEVLADWVDARTITAVVPSVREGVFDVDVRVTQNEVPSEPLPARIRFARSLVPDLRQVRDGSVHVNDPIRVEGDDFLLGGGEGDTVAILDGTSEGARVSARVPATPVDAFERTVLTFPFAPEIRGIAPGRFEGTVRIANVLPEGIEDGSRAVRVAFDVLPPRLDAVEPEEVSLGQYLFFSGGGFVWGDDEVSLVRFEGSLDDEPFAVEILPEPLWGREARYAIEESDALGSMLDLRNGTERLSGTFTLTVVEGGERVSGAPFEASFSIRPVKQVVHVRFLPEWADALDAFGLRAADDRIRRRVMEVARRDFAGINVEFRDEPPTDFALWSLVDVGGEDPNGQGLLGYDNSPGKDVGNLRLYDRIGGANALTQEDGYPGFGGVFALSFLGFREHEALFRDVFDDTIETPATAEEVETAPAVGPGDCPGRTRLERVACAANVLGNLVGSTLTHEIGHSVGLAEPFGLPDTYHNPGDEPNRLMDYADARPFAERAELGAGPAMFCEEEFAYLREILPSDDPPPAVRRPGCY